jgi:hypothetical protein
MVVVIYIPIFKHGDHIQSQSMVAIYLISASLLIWGFGRAFFLFMYVAALDVGRFLSMVQTLHKMIRLTDLMVDSSVSIKGETLTETNRDIAESRMQALLNICDTNHNPMAFSDASKVTSTDSLFYFDLESKEEMDQLSTTCANAAKGNAKLPFYEFLDLFTYRFLYSAKNTMLGEKLAEHLDLAMIPRVNLLQSENSTAWIYARLAIQHFGERFRFRTDGYTGQSFYP